MPEADFIFQSWLKHLSPYVLLCNMILPCLHQEVEPNSPSLESSLSNDSSVTNRMPWEWYTTSEARSQKTLQLPPGSLEMLVLGEARHQE